MKTRFDRERLDVYPEAIRFVTRAEGIPAANASTIHGTAPFFVETGHAPSPRRNIEQRIVHLSGSGSESIPIPIATPATIGLRAVARFGIRIRTGSGVHKELACAV